MSDCPTCGAHNVEASAFCTTCGTRLPETGASSTITFGPPPPPQAPPPTQAPPRLQAPPQAPPQPPPLLTPPPPTYHPWTDARTAIAPPPAESSIGLFGRLFGTSAPAPRPAAPPFVIYENKSGTTIPLRQSFRFMHEPVGLNGAAPFVGRQNEMESLAERILFSDGGSFLVTGYRGVGKTSFINRVIAMVRDASSWARPLLGHTEVVDIQLNVARPVQPSEIMHHIIRRLHDRLVELGIYPHLDAELRDALALAFQRTSVNMARKLGESSERSFGVNEASIGGDFLKAAMKMSWSSKRGRTSNTEMSYLGYDDKAAEHDIITIARRLTAGYARTPTRWERMRLQRASPRRLKIVFVFDELDKLEEFTPPKLDDKGKPADQKPVIDQILGALKNLFTTSGVSFVFVAGKDLQERWLEDIGRGDSVYESVFSYDKYLPCLWTDVDAICDALVDREQWIEPYRAQAFAAFKKYLAYRGRGIPRRIIRTFNEYVEWNGDRPALAFTNKDVRRIRFFAGLQDLLESNRATLFGDEHEEIAGTQSDKRRLGVYYLLDWMLRQGSAEFTLPDVLRASARLSAKIALAEEIAPHVAEDIVRILLDASYIETPRRSLARVVVGDANAEEPRRYRVTERRLVEMGAQAKDAELDAIGPHSDPFLAKEDRLPTAIGRFRVVHEIAKGGMGIVYRAIDGRNGRDVAVKLLAPGLAANPDMEARFEREARILDALDHPDIVRLVDWGRDEGRIYIAMELIDGVTLDDVTRRLGKLDPGVAAALVRRVAEAAEYVHDRGIVRLDLKPSNIMLAVGGGVRLLDFGISRGTSDDGTGPAGRRVTQTGLVVGTPQFMAPEQFSKSAVDARADVYSLGVILFHLLTDRYPFEGDETYELMRAHLEKVPPAPSSFAPAARELDAIVLRCLEKDPNRRFQTMAALAHELTRVTGALPAADIGEIVAQVRTVARDADVLDDMRTQEGNAPQAVSVPFAPPPAPVMAAAPQASAATDEHAWPMNTMASSPPRPQVASPVAAPVAAPTVAPVAMHDPRPRLTLMRGHSEEVVSSLETLGASLLLAKETRVGRNSANEIVLRHASVSRFHASFVVADGRCTVEDANTPRGTMVNGERIIAPRVLRGGDEIQIGEIAFRYDGS